MSDPHDANSHFSVRTRTDTRIEIGRSVAKSLETDIAEPLHLGPHDPWLSIRNTAGNGCNTPTPTNGRAKTPLTWPGATTMYSNSVGKIDKATEHIPLVSDPKKRKHKRRVHLKRATEHCTSVATVF